MTDFEIANLPEDERQHFHKCKICGEWLDRRDLAQVFEHEHKGLSHPQFSSSRKVGEPIQYNRDGTKSNLN